MRTTVVTAPPRQNAARPAAKPEPAAAPRSGSAIEPHLRSFFDQDQDRRISLVETYSGLRNLGIGRAGAAAVALGINAGLGLKTGGGLLTIDLDNITRGKHAGDSGVIDSNGNFDAAAFDAVFERHARKYGDALTAEEMTAFRQANHARDPETGVATRVATLGELGLLFALGAEERGGEKVLTRGRLLEFYTKDGLFETIAKENELRRADRATTFSGRLQNLFNTWIF